MSEPPSKSQATPPTAHLVTFERGEERWELYAETGERLFHVARGAQVPVETLCHGIGACVRCKVRVVEGELSKPTPVERDKMGNIFHLTGERMACQAEVIGPVKLELPRPRRPKRRRG